MTLPTVKRPSTSSPFRGTAPVTQRRRKKNPREVFQRLFGKAGGEAFDRSVLDKVTEDAKRLAKRLSTGDRSKLDEYLESIRQTERRIQLAEAASLKVQTPPLSEPMGIPQNRGEYLRLMIDLIVYAFQLDLTRVATLVVDPERWDSPRMFDGVFETHRTITY